MHPSTDNNGLPGGDEAADEMSRALKKAAAARRDPDDHEIAADDAGGTNVAEQSETPKA